MLVLFIASVLSKAENPFTATIDAPEKRDSFKKFNSNPFNDSRQIEFSSSSAPSERGYSEGNIAPRKKIKTLKNSPHAGDSTQNSDNSEFIRASKELLKKNNEFIKKVEKNLKTDKDGTEIASNQARGEIKTQPSIEKMTSPSKVEIKPLEKQEKSPFPIIEPKKSPAVAFEAPSPLIDKMPAQNNSMRKISDLLFKSTIVTKSEILNKEDAAVLIENNNKVKSIIGQLQKIFESTSGILKKFQDSSVIEDKPAVAKDKPKDVMKYQVIEVTEDKKENK